MTNFDQIVRIFAILVTIICMVVGFVFVWLRMPEWASVFFLICLLGRDALNKPSL
jgi:hypothetical protein